MYSNEGFNLRRALYIFFISCSNEFLHLNSSKCDNNYGGGGGKTEGFSSIHHNVYSTVVCNEKPELLPCKKRKTMESILRFYVSKSGKWKEVFKHSHPSRSVSCFSFPGN